MKRELTQGEQIDLAQARQTLLKADWEVSREQKELARKIIDSLTGNAAKRGFKGQ